MSAFYFRDGMGWGEMIFDRYHYLPTYLLNIIIFSSSSSSSDK
jgi:hypothetical protein